MDLDYSYQTSTPASSVASSPRLRTRHVEPSTRRGRHSSASQAIGHPCGICFSTTCRDEKHRAARKNKKERENRSDLQSSIQLMQDVLCCFIYTPKATEEATKQNQGNASSSGLLYKKIELSRDGMAVFIRMLQKAEEQARREGTLDELKNEYQAWISAAREHEDPTVGSWMYNPEPRCFHIPGQKVCAIHREAKWWDCRLDKVANNFKRNVKEWRKRFLLQSKL